MRSNLQVIYIEIRILKPSAQRNLRISSVGQLVRKIMNSLDKARREPET